MMHNHDAYSCIWPQARCEAYSQQLSGLQQQSAVMPSDRDRDRDRQTMTSDRDRDRQTVLPHNDGRNDAYAHASSNLRTPSNGQGNKEAAYNRDRDDRDGSRLPFTASAGTAARSTRDAHTNSAQGRRSLGGYGIEGAAGARIDGPTRRSSAGGYGVDGATGRSSPVAASTPLQPSYPAGSNGNGNGLPTASTPVQPSYSAPGNGYVHNASTPVLQHHVAVGTPLGQAQPQPNSRPAAKDKEEVGRGRDASEGTPGKQAPDLAMLVRIFVSVYADKCVTYE